MIKTYYLLMKPGIIFGNLITTAGGFALASKGHFDLWLFIVTLVGLSCVIASACVCNNYIDRESDKKMERTKHRALVKGLISGQNAVMFAISLGITGFLALSIYTNLLTVLIALTGFLFYVILYSFGKYLSSFGTVIGSIAGAVPPVVGYCAVTNRIDAGALLLFLILILWQMPHFFAIAMYRFEDYVAASIPVLPVIKGMRTTKIHMLLYIIAFIPATLALTLCGYTGYTYLAVALLLGIAWLWLCVKGFKSTNDKLWARQMFLFSLVTITALCPLIAVDTISKL